MGFTAEGPRTEQLVLHLATRFQNVLTRLELAKAKLEAFGDVLERKLLLQERESMVRRLSAPEK